MLYRKRTFRNPWFDGHKTIDTLQLSCLCDLDQTFFSVSIILQVITPCAKSCLAMQKNEQARFNISNQQLETYSCSLACFACMCTLHTIRITFHNTIVVKFDSSFSEV